eukprot:311775-Prorocentrum_minimum.AAC.1
MIESTRARLPAAAANQLVPDDRGRGEWAAPRLAAALAAAAPARGDDAGEGSGRAAPAEDAPHPLARARSRSHELIGRLYLPMSRNSAH